VTRQAFAIVIALLWLGSEARAEKLTVALSTREVKIDSNFTGTSIVIFGVIVRDAGSVSRNSDYAIATVVLGPAESIVARRKDRFLGIWANGASETIPGVPSFYAADSSGPLGEIAIPPLLRQYGIGFANIPAAYSGRGAFNDPEADEFWNAFIRLKQEAGLYEERPAGVTFIGDAIFRSSVAIPANVPIGRYRVAVYLFAGGTLLGEADDTVEVTKSGFEQYMSTASRSHSFIYGLACVCLALFTGWIAGVVFRRD